MVTVRVRSWRTELIAGLTTFFSMAYIAFLNPSVLAPTGLPTATTFFWTSLVAGVLSCLAGWLLRTPTAIASGMGINTFIAAYSVKFHVPWPTMLACCVVAGAIVFVLGVCGVRRRVLDSLPPQLIQSVKAGVGAVLTSVAITETSKFGATQGLIDRFGAEGSQALAWGLFAAGIAIISVPYYWHARRQTADQAQPGWAFFLSIAVLLVLSWIVFPAEALRYSERQPLWAWLDVGVADIGWREIFGPRLSLVLVLMFLLLIDFVGGPYDFLKTYPNEAPRSSTDQARTIGTGFALDSLGSVGAALAGVSPVVFYLENHAGWAARGRSGIVAMTVGACFLLLAAFGAVCLWTASPITRFIPSFCAMPTLFFVGMAVIADSFRPQLQSELDAKAEGAVFVYFPAAITAVLASITSLDRAIASGILVYALTTLLPDRYLGITAQSATYKAGAAALWPFYLGAFLALFIDIL